MMVKLILLRMKVRFFLAFYTQITGIIFMANQKISLEVEEKNLKLVISEPELPGAESLLRLLSCIDRLKVSTKILLATFVVLGTVIIWCL